MEIFRRDLRIVQKRLQKCLHLSKYQSSQVRHFNRVLQGCIFVGHNPRNKLAFQHLVCPQVIILKSSSFFIFLFIGFWLPEIRRRYQCEANFQFCLQKYIITTLFFVNSVSHYSPKTKVSELCYPYQQVTVTWLYGSS